MESKFENITFARVDADTLDKLIAKEDSIPSKLTKEDEEALKPVFEGVVDKDKFKVQFESMSESDAPVVLTQPEFIRRMMEQQKYGGAGFMGEFPETYNMVVNSNHPKIGDILSESDAAIKENKAKQLADLALLAQGMLKGEKLSDFVKRSVELI